MANDRSNSFFNVLALENILVALTKEIGDGPCFLYIKFSWIGVDWIRLTLVIFLTFFEKIYNDWIKCKLPKSRFKWTGLYSAGCQE
jgi:hypothetical protein